MQNNRYERTGERFRTTNSLERLNQEIRRRQRVIRIFPNRESALRLIGAALMEQDELWSTGHRYLRMEGLQVLASGTGEKPEP